MLGPDTRDLLRIRRDKARTCGAARHSAEARPTDSSAPERGDFSIEHHGRTVTGAVEINRLEILVLLQPETIQDVARQDRKTGAARAERNRLTDEIADGLVRAVRAHDEHSRA